MLNSLLILVSFIFIIISFSGSSNERKFPFQLIVLFGCGMLFVISILNFYRIRKEALKEALKEVNHTFPGK